jgi:hypothetical protein
MGNIIFSGCPAKGKTDISVNVVGNVNTVGVKKGDVYINGDVIKNVHTVNGSIQANRIIGSIEIINRSAGGYHYDNTFKASTTANLSGDLLDISIVKGTGKLSIDSVEYIANRNVKIANGIVALDDNKIINLDAGAHVSVSIIGECDYVKSGPLNVSIDGTVNDDVICVSGNITVTGDIGGNARTVNGDIKSDNKI